MPRALRFTGLFLALVTGAVSSLTALPLQFGPPTRLSPFRIGAPGYDLALRVESSGAGFVAYWEHRQDFGFVPYPTPRQEIRSVEASGSLSDLTPPTARTIAGTPPPPGGFQACNDTHCATAYNDGTSLVIEVVSRTDGTSVRVEHASLTPAVIASDPGGFAVTDSTAAHFVRVDNSGHLTADASFPQLPASTINTGSALAFNGDTYALFYAVNLAEIDARNVRLDGTLVSTTKVTSSNLAPMRAAWNGGDYLLALVKPDLSARIPEATPPTDLYALRVGPSLLALGQPFVLSTGGANPPAGIAANGGVFYVLWTHIYDRLLSPTPHQSVIEGAAVAASGEFLTHEVLSFGPLPQENPTVGLSTSTALVTWTETDMQTRIASLRYALVDRASHATLASGEIDSAVEIQPGDVVALGGDFLVVWLRSSMPAVGQFEARAAIIRQNTTRENIAPLPWAFIRAAANADHWLIAGATANSNLTIAIKRDGRTDDPAVITPGTFVGGLASDGDRFLMTTFWLTLLDHDGKLISLQTDQAEDVDSADGRFGALEYSGSSTLLAIYDHEARRIAATPVAALAAFTTPVLTHVGPWFIVSYTDINNVTYMDIVASDGTVIASAAPVPRGVIAKTDSPRSTAILIQPDAAGGAFAEDALFVSDVQLDMSSRRRAARH